MKMSSRLAWLALGWLMAVASGVSAAEPRVLRALLVCGGCCHDYPVQKDVLKRGIESRARITVDTVQQGGTSKESQIPLYENPNWAKGYDLVIHDECFGAVADTNWISRDLAPNLSLKTPFSRRRKEGCQTRVVRC